MRSKLDNRPRDATLARIARNQHGVVTTAQLTDTGLSTGRISERVAAGRLHRIHRGVYAVGHQRLSNEGTWMAAVLACGDGAVLSHTSAAALWGIRRRARPRFGDGHRESDAVHVTIPGTPGRAPRRGIALHRSVRLKAADSTLRDGIPVTTPARTLNDLRHLLSPAQFATAVRESEFLGLPIGDVPPTDRARTDLEQLFTAMCRRHRLPKPEVNVKIDRFEVDFLWPDRSLVVEVDGWESHRTRSAFEEDRARDARLTLLGYQVVRFTWRQIERDAHGVAGTIRSLLQA
jgi:very-short-patch-repair endonuclease